MNKKDITIGYACLECRKVFKKNKYILGKNGKWGKIEYEVVCPQCANLMYETGTAFKAPKTSDIKSWEKIIPLFKKGYKFNTGSISPFIEPEKIKKPKTKVPESVFRKQARKRDKA